MPRGRLIFPFLCELSRLDSSATSQDPDGAGDLTSGYDSLWREPAIVPQGDTGKSARQEFASIRVPAQIEDDTWMRLRQMLNGVVPETRTTLVMHFSDLEDAGLVDAAGMALVRVGDRLEAIYDMDENLVQRVPTPPGLYVTEATPAGFGLGTHRNLLLVTVKPRDQGKFTA